jgi:hypothetical protein
VNLSARDFLWAIIKEAALNSNHIHDASLDEMLSSIPAKRQAIWQSTELTLSNIDRTIIYALKIYLQENGEDQEGRKKILLSAYKTAVCNLGLSMVGDFDKSPTENLKYILGGRFRASLLPLIEAIIQNRILGIGILSSTENEIDNYIISALLAKNILVIGINGVDLDENIPKEIGEGLREFCKATGMPPVLNFYVMRYVFELLKEVMAESEWGEDFSDMPVMALSMNQSKEKNAAAACGFMLSGISVISPIKPEDISEIISTAKKSDFGKCVCAEGSDAVKYAVEILNQKRDALSINKKTERKLFDMKDRRAFDV